MVQIYPWRRCSKGSVSYTIPWRPRFQHKSQGKPKCLISSHTDVPGPGIPHWEMLLYVCLRILLADPVLLHKARHFNTQTSCLYLTTFFYFSWIFTQPANSSGQKLCFPHSVLQNNEYISRVINNRVGEGEKTPNTEGNKEHLQMDSSPRFS